jgi:hypothetical protein
MYDKVSVDVLGGTMGDERQTAVASSLDPFCRLLRQFGQNRQPEALGCHHIDDDLERRGLLDWKVGLLWRPAESCP